MVGAGWCWGAYCDTVARAQRDTVERCLRALGKTGPAVLRLGARMTLLDALDDAALFQPYFPLPAWSAWRAFGAALYGLPMSAAERAVYTACTGREQPPTARAGEGWVIAGRRSGKSRTASVIAAYTAALADTSMLAPGEPGTVLICAATKRQGAIIFGYTRALFTDVPSLRPLVVGEQAAEDSKVLELRHGVRIEVRSANFRTVRGATLLLAIIDEVAFLRDEQSANPDLELVRALRPGLTTTNGMLLGLSNPWARRGVLWQKYRKHYGQDGAVLVWRAPTETMNSMLAAAVLAEAAEDDPEAAAAEYGAEFRADLESFVSMDVLDAVTTPGVTERPPCAGRDYVAFLDVAGGSGRDSIALAVAHAEDVRDSRLARAVLDAVREVKPPFDPLAVAGELAAVLTAYGVLRVQADRYAGAWVVEAFRPHGIVVDQSAEPKSVLYLSALPLFTAGRCDLLDLPRLRLQLAGLERRRRAGGRDIVDHPPGGHDDVANVVAGVVVLASNPPTVSFLFDDAMATVAADDAPAAEAQQMQAGIAEWPGRLDPDRVCGTCVHFRDGVCTSSGEWGNHTVAPSLAACTWYDPLPVGEESPSELRGR
jgi:hypothetical protein